MDQTLKSMEQMMLQLVEDRCKREEEFAAERAGWERAAEKHIEAMQAQTEALMTLVQDSHKAEPPTTMILAGVSQMKLIQLTEQDNIEAYLVTFEQIIIMQVYEIPRAQWTYHLAPQLTGKAQQLFAALPLSKSKAYDGVKTAILLRYGISKETYRQRFRTTSRNSGETNRELVM